MLLVLFALFVTYAPFTSYHVKTNSQSDVSFFILKSAYGQTPDMGSSNPSMDNSTDISNSTDASTMNNGTDITNQNDPFSAPGTTPDVSSDLGNPVENTTANSTQTNEITNQAVPEFGSTAVMVLLISITVFIVYTTKSINKLF